MSRIKIKLPETFSFSTNIPIRIGDINYGNHVGNDAVLSIIHEARMQFFFQYSYTELDCGGVGLIMYDAALEFKKELFYGDVISVSIQAVNFTLNGFDLYYKIEKKENGKSIIAAIAKTGMLCFDYALKKIALMPKALKEKLVL